MDDDPVEWRNNMNADASLILAMVLKKNLGPIFNKLLQMGLIS
jgi:hypothetical protein